MRGGRRTIAAERKRSGGRGRRVADRAAERKREQPLTAAQRRIMAQAMVCGGVFVVLVAVKILFPGATEEIKESARSVLERNIDVQTVFSALGRSVSGETESIREELYQAVFGQDAIAEKGEGEKIVPGEPRAALRLLRSAVQAQKPDEEVGEILYSEENLPKDVSMQQAILGFPVCTPVAGTLTSSFGYREHPVDGEDAFHYGVDLAAATGTKILSFADGTVGVVGESSSFGKYCTVNHSGGCTTLYAHCDRILVRSGASVKRGEEIAEVGKTGIATGSHLHFELQYDGVYLNPIYYIDCEKGM